MIAICSHFSAIAINFVHDICCTATLLWNKKCPVVNDLDLTVQITICIATAHWTDKS